MTVTVFRNTDANAPVVSGAAGTLTDMLRGVLSTGYGSVFATGTVTSSGVLPTDGDTVTIGTITYRFKTAIAALNDVLIGATAAAALANLQATINLHGTSGTTYLAGQLTNPTVWCTNVTATVVTLQARVGGTGGNSIALSKVAATLTVSGANLAGGSGSNATVSAGWSNPFNGNGGQAVFRGGSGVQHYYHVDDSSPNTTALGKEAQFRGSVGATAFQSGTEFFPTVAVVALLAGIAIRKSNTADPTPRPWIVFADDRTAYGFVATGDVAGTYFGFMLGEFFSLLTPGPDLYRSMIIGRTGVNSALTAQEAFGSGTTPGTGIAGHWAPRAYNAGGVAISPGKTIATGLTGNQGMGGGAYAGVEPVTAAIIPTVIDVHDGAAFTNLRGRMRGLFATTHTVATFGDGEPILGSAAYAGRILRVVKQINATATAAIAAIDETGPWETN